MNCLHPFTRRYIDSLTQEPKECLCPCGKCINCLHSYQDSWSIRLQETAKAYKKVVYDTLTLTNEVADSYDFLEPDSFGQYRGTTKKAGNLTTKMLKKSWDKFHQYFPKYSQVTYKILQKNDFKVYTFPKKEVQNWIKRGRQDFFRDKGYYPDFSYFITQEYGPTTSRPHFHLLIFGLDYADYVTYWGTPWKYDYGFTFPTYLTYKPSTLKDFNCITRYVSKYVSKGQYESPLVIDGLQPKTYKLISKGIGESYTEQDFFKVFSKSPLAKYKDIHCQSEKVFYSTLAKLEEAGKDTKKYIEEYERKKADVATYLAFVNYTDPELTEEQLNRLVVYYDNSGFAHPMPRYIKNKILGVKNEKNIYESKIQDLLHKNLELHVNKVKEGIACSLGFITGDNTGPSSLEGLSPEQRFMVDFQYDVAEKDKANTLAERRKTRLVNLYNRPLRRAVITAAI